MSIWRQKFTLEALEQMGKGTLNERLDMRFVEIGEDFLSASMPVDERTRQPFGLLHGGASVALAETLGSVAAAMCVRDPRQRVVGLEINANHVRAARSGRVTGTVTPVHIGGRTQVWQIHVRDEAQRLICLSRITMAVLDAD